MDSDKNEEFVSPEDIAAQQSPTIEPPLPASIAQSTIKPENRFSRLIGWVKTHKKKSIPLIIAIVLGLLLLVPPTRYLLLGTVVHKNFKVAVVDAKTSAPITKAEVTIDGNTVETDNKGLATVSSAVGTQQVMVTKKYYKDADGSTLIPIKQKDSYVVKLEATGRQVPIVITNKISGKPLSNALVTAAGTEVKTDKNGKAIIVLPADKSKVNGKVSAKGYNDATITIEVAERSLPANTFAVTPAGKVYFLSKLSGKIDVVRTNLDGSGRSVVLAGTGKEDNYNTVLLASRDWKYLALLSKRDGSDYAKLFLLDTVTGKLSTMDEGDKVRFDLAGWSGHHFVYTVNRTVQDWEPKRQAIKSYDATNDRLATLDESEGEGTGSYDYAYTNFSQPYILDDTILYTTSWYANYYNRGHLNGKSASLMSVNSDGSGKKTVKDFPVALTNPYFGVQLSLYEPKAVYVQAPDSNDASRNVFYEYEDGKLVSKDLTQEDFNKGYPTFLVSPSGNKVFWSEDRDGKNSLFIGDDEGKNEKQVASLSEYTQYGWYSDDYLLVSKNASELFILPATGGVPVKITDFHKPNITIRGYGGGYGGL